MVGSAVLVGDVVGVFVVEEVVGDTVGEVVSEVVGEIVGLFVFKESVGLFVVFSLTTLLVGKKVGDEDDTTVGPTDGLLLATSDG